MRYCPSEPVTKAPLPDYSEQRAQCSACKEVFSGTSNFDAHRKGEAEDRYCVDPASVGLVVKTVPDGTLWSSKERK